MSSHFDYGSLNCFTFESTSGFFGFDSLFFFGPKRKAQRSKTKESYRNFVVLVSVVWCRVECIKKTVKFILITEKS